jgi:tetratricopeptide (TPR) repeat protein
MINLRTALALSVFLAGCGAPGPQPPAAQARLDNESARAASQARAGDHAGAARRYEEALRIARTLDDADAVAVNSLNLSIVYARMGREADAKSVLGPLLADERNAYAPARRTQAELRMAIMALAAREYAPAGAWAARAQERCQAIGCAQLPSILNVMAQAALETGKPADAATLAYAALDRAKQADDKSEMGNALRLAGRALRAQGDAAGAIKPLEQAWEIDRELADPRKLMADLLELAHANLAAGNKQAARDYQERAAAISRSLRNEK